MLCWSSEGERLGVGGDLCRTIFNVVIRLLEV